MDNERRTLAAIGAILVLGLGLVGLATVYAANGREAPAAVWSLLAAVAGGLLATLPGLRR